MIQFDHHKYTASIMAATGIPYVFTAIEGYGTDLVAKAAKAQWHAKHNGLAFVEDPGFLPA